MELSLTLLNNFHSSIFSFVFVRAVSNILGNFDVAIMPY